MSRKRIIRPCSICGSVKSSKLFSYKAMMPVRSGPAVEFDCCTVMCGNCGFIYRKYLPVPERKLKEYYSNAAPSFNPGRPDYSVSKREELIKSEKFGESYLEIGQSCNTEYFESLLPSFSKGITVVEPNRNASFVLSSAGDWYYDISEIPKKRKFGTIGMFYVLEHVPDPLEFLIQCRQHMINGSKIIIEVPSVTLYQDYPAAAMNPEHISHFGIESLERLMIRAGFYNVRRVIFPSRPYGTCMAGMYWKDYPDSEYYMSAVNVHKKLQSAISACRKHILSGKRVVIWGANAILEQVLSEHVPFPAPLNLFVIDSDPEKQRYFERKCVVHNPADPLDLRLILGALRITGTKFYICSRRHFADISDAAIKIYPNCPQPELLDY